jgi:hypothetical protein
VALVLGRCKDLITAWIRNRWGKTPHVHATVTLPIIIRPTGTVPAKYVALHKYLTERYADAVTMSFTQIEDVLGSQLPDVARALPEWWTAASGQSGSHTQAQAWALAGRTAEPNLGAQIVRFERAPSR